MPDSPALITSLEHCSLDGYWTRDWERLKIDFNELLRAGIQEGLTTNRPDFGEVAGERILDIASKREITKDVPDVYGSVYHHASIADIGSCAIRKPSEPPWRIPEPVQLGDGPLWTPACLLEPKGSHLRRVVIVSSWSDDRHYHEARSWFSLGEVCVYGLPMQEIVIILGPLRDGKRHSHWTKGVMHPANRKLRFRRKNFIGQGFKETWTPCWREERDEIPTKDWLQAMLDDGVLEESIFRIDIPVPVKEQRERIVELAKRKLEKLMAMEDQPDQNLSVCDWPTPCHFRNNCHSNQQPSGRFGFVRIT